MWKILAGVFIFMAVAATGVAYYYLTRTPSGPTVSIEYSQDKKIYLGESFDLPVAAVNNSDELINSAKLAIRLPEGLFFSDKPQDLKYEEFDLGDLQPGAVVRQSVELIASGDSQTVRHVQAILSYTGSKTNNKYQFEKKNDLSISIEQPAVSLSIDSPKAIYGGESVVIKITYTNTSRKDLSNLKLKAAYPPGFSLNSAEPPDAEPGTWEIPALPAGSSGTVTISGAAAPLGEAAFVNFEAGMYLVSAAREYLISRQYASIGIQQSPLLLSITVNGKTDYTAAAGDLLEYQINYKNNTDATLADAVISAKFSGALFDFQNLQTNGSFNSVDNSVSWNASVASELSSIAPGAGGNVMVRLPLKLPLPVRKAADKNFTVSVSAVMESPTVPQNTAAQKTSAAAALQTRIAGNLQSGVQGFYNEISGRVKNSGPYPPRVNQKTQYTIHWSVKNPGADMSNIHFSAFLQSGTKFARVVKNSAGTAPAYNANTGEVTWDIAKLPANSGVIGGAIEAIFQIENMPAVNQINQTYSLLSATNVKGHDDFANRDIVQILTDVDIQLPDDTTISTPDRRVQN